MNLEVLATTFVGYIVPILFLLYARWRNSTLTYVTLACFTTFMGAVGLGKLLPFFGHSAVGGSLYFPTALLAMAMAGHYIRSEQVIRKMHRALMLGCMFMVIGALRWFIFAMYGADFTTHNVDDTFELTLVSAVMVFKVYLASMIALWVARYRTEQDWMLVLPVMLEIVVTTPLAVYAAIRLNPTLPEPIGTIMTWTLIVRLSMPVVFAGVLMVMQRYRPIPRCSYRP